jgi:hypothetical protein
MTMDRTKRSNRRAPEGSAADTPHEGEPESPLLREARGWAGAAREAQARIRTDRAAEFLETHRRNGPGQ